MSSTRQKTELKLKLTYVHTAPQTYICATFSTAVSYNHTPLPNTHTPANMEQTRWEDEEVCGTSAIAPPPAPSHVAPPASQQQQPSPAAHHCDVPVAATAASSASVAQHHHHHHHSARRLASSASRQSSSTRIVLYILSTMATAFRLKARETDSVAKLKARIAHATGIPVWSQALVVRDTELADNSGTDPNGDCGPDVPLSLFFQVGKLDMRSRSTSRAHSENTPKSLSLVSIS